MSFSFFFQLGSSLNYLRGSGKIPQPGLEPAEGGLAVRAPHHVVAPGRRTPAVRVAYYYYHHYYHYYDYYDYHDYHDY